LSGFCMVLVVSYRTPIPLFYPSVVVLFSVTRLLERLAFPFTNEPGKNSKIANLLETYRMGMLRFGWWWWRWRARHRNGERIGSTKTSMEEKGFLFVNLGYPEEIQNYRKKEYTPVICCGFDDGPLPLRFGVTPIQNLRPSYSISRDFLPFHGTNTKTNHHLRAKTLIQKSFWIPGLGCQFWCVSPLGSKSFVGADFRLRYRMWLPPRPSKNLFGNFSCYRREV